MNVAHAAGSEIGVAVADDDTNGDDNDEDSGHRGNAAVAAPQGGCIHADSTLQAAYVGT